MIAGLLDQRSSKDTCLILLSTLSECPSWSRIARTGHALFCWSLLLAYQQVTTSFPSFLRHSKRVKQDLLDHWWFDPRLVDMHPALSPFWRFKLWSANLLVFRASSTQAGGWLLHTRAAAAQAVPSSRPLRRCETHVPVHCTFINLMNVQNEGPLIFLVPASNHFRFWCRSFDEMMSLRMNNDYKT